MGVFIANRLTVTVGGLLPQALSSPPPGTPPYLAKYMPDGAYEVKQLQVLDDGLQIRVAPATISSTQPPKVLTAKTSNVRLAQDATVRDLLLLADDRIQPEPKGDSISLQDLRVRTKAFTLAMSAQERSLLSAVSTKLTAIVDALDTVQRTAGAEDKSSLDSEPEVAAGLKRWLKARGYSRDKLEQQANALNRMVGAKQSWDGKKAGLSITTETVATRTLARATIRFNQRSWVFTYLTPILGYAVISDSFTTFYAGLQLNFVPNPVNDPQWNHGASDFARFLALELAIGPKGGSFGPDQRYTGIDSIPPLFIGLATHPLPYASITIGKTLLKRRASALPAEDPQLASPWYFGFNVQANIPDLVRELSKPTTATTVEKK